MIVGLSHPFLGLGPGALGIGKNSGVFLKIGKKTRHILLSIYLFPFYNCTSCTILQTFRVLLEIKYSVLDISEVLHGFNKLRWT